MRLWLNRTGEVSLREQLMTQIMLGILSREMLPGHPKVNWHPALLATMAAAGIGIGIAASQQGASTRTAAAGGLATALMVGAVGYPIAVMQEQDRGFFFAYQFPVARFGDPRMHGIVHWSGR